MPITTDVATARWKNHTFVTPAHRSLPECSHGAGPVAPDTFGMIQYQSTKLET